MRTETERRDGPKRDGDEVKRSAGGHGDLVGSDARLIQAYGDFLGKLEWSHAATLTFRRDVHPEQAMKEFKRFVRDLIHRSQGQVKWFTVIEDTYQGRAHIHALLAVKNLGTEEIASSWEWRNRKIWPGRGVSLSPRSLPKRSGPEQSSCEMEVGRRQWVLDEKAKKRKREWWRGHNKVEPFDPKRGWAYYILKEITGKVVEYDFDI